MEVYSNQVVNWFNGLPFFTQCMLVVILVFCLLFNWFYNHKVISFGPTILTTLGIFGTFLGIARGLAHFNVGDLQGSVPELLDGLKTAIWASVAGVGGALLLKLRHQFLDRTIAEGSGEHGDVTAADLARILGGIQSALVGTEDSSLLSQLKLLRSDVNDRLQSLESAQAQALEKLSEMGSKALVEALRDVIKDFNARITEQFGDNFKALNEAVGQLLEWQNRYRGYIESTQRSLDGLINTLKEVTANYETVVLQSKAFSNTAQDLQLLLDGLSTQKDLLATNSRALAELLKEASGSLPQVEAKVLELTKQLSSAVEQNQRAVQAALHENATQLKATMQSAQQGVVSTNAEANKQVTELISKTKEQIAHLDAALTEELKKSLESLGRQLAALSEKFVSDYSPLTDKLRRVVEMAK